MKVRIVYTVEAPDNFRRALNFRYGKPGLATRKELKYHFEEYGKTLDDDVMDEYRKAVKDGEEPEMG